MKPIAVMAAALLLTLTACGKGEAAGQAGLSGTVTVLGSTSMERVMKTLAEQFSIDHEGITVTVEGGGSGAGAEAVRGGTADIGMVSRALKESEESAGVTGTLLAVDGIVVIVNAANPVNDLTVEQIAALFTGETANWSQVGGDALAVAPVGRESGSGTRDGFESVTGTKGRCALSQELTSAGGVVEAVRGNVQAIGYTSLASVEGQRGVKAITVDGAACTEEALRDGSYPLQRPFLLVTNGEEPLAAQAQAFFDWITSPAANDLIRRAGAVPVA